ncbi:MAG: hypothetical protein K2X77_06875 [Candidatus Obscuribacterales bacterium]|jgi:hypothetical protein|nr:hypothetical protein [Candidatus Obscuribacterales bacterium]
MSHFFALTPNHEIAKANWVKNILSQASPKQRRKYKKCIDDGRAVDFGKLRHRMIYHLLGANLGFQLALDLGLSTKYSYLRSTKAGKNYFASLQRMCRRIATMHEDLAAGLLISSKEWVGMQKAAVHIFAALQDPYASAFISEATNTPEQIWPDLMASRCLQLTLTAFGGIPLDSRIDVTRYFWNRLADVLLNEIRADQASAYVVYKLPRP